MRRSLGTYERALTVSTHNHALVTELLSNILRSAAADLNPYSGEESASSQNEGKVEDGVERIQHQLSYGTRRGDEVGESCAVNRLR